MEVLIERSVLRDLGRFGVTVMRDLHGEITRRGVAPEADEDPDGDHCRCSYRVGAVTLVGTYSRSSDSLLLDRLVHDTVVDAVEDRLPLAFLARLVAGEHPVKLWREHRRMKQMDLAQAAGIGQGYLSEVEAGKKLASPRMLARLAAVLGVEPGELTPPGDASETLAR